MQNLAYRRGLIQELSSGKFGPKTGVSIVVYKPGAQANGGQTGLTINVHRGHGFPAAGGVKLIIMRLTGGLWSMVAGSFRAVTASTETTLTVDTSSLTVLDGDYLVNLGNDQGSSYPLFTASPVLLYGNQGGTGSAFTNATFSPNGQGEISYWTWEPRVWELVLSGTIPVELVVEPTYRRGDYGVLDVRDFGAKGDGTTDDTAAFLACAAAVPSVLSQNEGRRVLIPRGTYIVGSQVRWPQGTMIEGEGALSSVVKMKAGFTDAALFLFQQLDGDFAAQGIGIRDLVVDCAGQNGHAIRVYKGYDAVTFDTVLVKDVGDASSAFRFEPNPAGGNDVSQTIELRNLYAIHKNLGATGDLYYFKGVQEATLTNLKGFGGYSSGVGNCNVFAFDGCRGVTFVGGAAALTQGRGIYVYSAARAAQGLTFIGVTFESCVTAFETDGLALGVQALSIYAPRNQSGTTTPPITNGGIVLKNTTYGTIEVGLLPSCTLDASCNNLIVRTPTLAKVVDAGVATSNNRIIAGTDDTNGVLGLLTALTIQGSFQIKQANNGGPALYLGHRDRTDYYRLLWSARAPAVDSDPGDNEFGLHLAYVSKAGVVTDVLNFGSNGDLLFYRNGVLQFTLTGNGVAFARPTLRHTIAGIVASTTQTQGQGPLTAELNVVATVANANDTVTLPAAVAGLPCTIINNGANTLRIFPASGDNLGAGVNTATTLAAGANVTYQAIDSTNWEVV